MPPTLWTEFGNLLGYTELGNSKKVYKSKLLKNIDTNSRASMFLGGFLAH